MKKLLFLLIGFIVTLSVAAQPEVYTPAPKSPANEATGQMPDVTISWYAVSGSFNLQYRLQVDTTMNFNSPLLVDITQTLITGYQLNELLFNTTYYWRVLAIDGITSPWSEIWSFTVFDVVTLSLPSNNSENKNPNEKITWKDKVGSLSISGVNYFEYQLDTSMEFNSPLLIEGVTTGSVFSGTTQNMQFGAIYYWRVRAGHTKDVSNWCNPFNMSIVSTVELKSPSNNATDQLLDVWLKWEEITGVVGYEYEISLNETFTNLIMAGEIDTIAVKASLLMFGNDYWWRVRARHMTDTSDYSEINKFTVINTVLLKTPSNNQTDVSTTPTLTWTAQTGIVEYQLQLDSDVNFGNPIVNYKPGAEIVEYKVLKKLNYESVYYWRMRAFSNGGLTADTTDWSTPWSFTTAGPAGISHPNTSGFAVYPNPSDGKLFIRIYAGQSQTARCEVMDLTGKTVLTRDLSVQTGENTIPVILDQVSQGIYIMRITLNGQTSNQKLVID